MMFNLPAKEQFSRTGENPSSGIFTKLFIGLQNTVGTAQWQKRFLWYAASAGDRQSFNESAKRIASWDFDRIIPCHGDVIESGGKGIFNKVFEWHLNASAKQWKGHWRRGGYQELLNERGSRAYFEIKSYNVYLLQRKQTYTDQKQMRSWVTSSRVDQNLRANGSQISSLIFIVTVRSSTLPSQAARIPAGYHANLAFDTFLIIEPESTRSLTTSRLHSKKNFSTGQQLRSRWMSLDLRHLNTGKRQKKKKKKKTRRATYGAICLSD